MGTKDMDLRRQIGQRLCDIREKEKHLTQQNVADDLGINRQQIKAWETAQNNISYEDLAMLAKYYGSDCDYILTGVHTVHTDIAEATGLSDHAIEILEVSPAGKFLAETINEFCNSNWPFAHEFIMIKNMAERISNTAETESDITDTIPDNYNFCTVSPEDFFRLYARRIGNCFAEAVVSWAMHKAGMKTAAEEKNEPKPF